MIVSPFACIEGCAPVGWRRRLAQRASAKLQSLKSLDGWVVSSNSRLREAWDYGIALLSFYVAFEVSFMVAFDVDQGASLDALDALLDAVFCLDMVVILLTTLRDEWGEEVLKPSQYLRGS